MTKKILIAGFACLSLMVIAQSSGTKDQAVSAAQTKDAHPKDVASGQASGRVAPMKLTSAQPTITDNKKTASAQAQDGNGQARVATGDLNGDGRADVAASASVSKPAGSQAVLSDPAASEQVKAPRDLATGQASGKRQYQPIIIRKVSDDEGMPAREQQSPKATGKTSASDDWHVPNAKSNGSNISVPPADLDGDGKADRESPTTSHPKGQARVAKGDVNGDGKADAAINNSHSNIKNTKDAATGQASGKRQHGDNTINKEADAAPKQ
jgi:FG-GAP repeat